MWWSLTIEQTFPIAPTPNRRTYDFLLSFLPLWLMVAIVQDSSWWKLSPTSSQATPCHSQEGWYRGYGGRGYISKDSAFSRLGSFSVGRVGAVLSTALCGEFYRVKIPGLSEFAIVTCQPHDQAILEAEHPLPLPNQYLERCSLSPFLNTTIGSLS